MKSNFNNVLQVGEWKKDDSAQTLSGRGSLLMEDMAPQAEMTVSIVLSFPKYNGGCTFKIGSYERGAYLFVVTPRSRPLVYVERKSQVFAECGDVTLDAPEDYRGAAFDAAVRQVLARCQAAGVSAGLHVHHADCVDDEVAWARAGANIVLHSGDISLFRQNLIKDIARLRQALQVSA